MTAAKLVTRCPACRTAFRVVADQLRLRQGLVRCGQCQTVFDANANMVPLPGQPAPAVASVAVPAMAAHDAPASAEGSGRASDAAEGRHQAAPLPSGMTSADERGASMQPGHGDDGDVAIFVPGNTSDEDAPGDAPDAQPHPRHDFQDDPGYDVPALDAPTMMMSYPRQPEPTEPTEPTEPAEPDDEPASLPAPPPSPSPALRSPTGERVLNASAFLRAPAADDTDSADGGHLRFREVPEPMYPTGTPAAARPVRAFTPAASGHAAPPADQPFATAPRSATQPAIQPAIRPAIQSAAQPATRSSAAPPAAGLTSEPAATRWTAAGTAAGDIGFPRRSSAQDSPAPAMPWHRRPATAVLVALLAIAALAQAAMLFRVDLAGRYPYLRPLLEAACEPFGCTVAPWRDIEALRIDTSQLQKQDEDSDEYLLAITLRNQGRASVALPAIELVMTDLQDQLLLRRVLQPSDYLAEDQSPFAQRGLVAGMELPLRVRFRTQQTAANYRVLIFYP